MIQHAFYVGFTASLFTLSLLVATPQTAAQTIASIEHKIIRDTNTFRLTQGRKKLKIDQTLTRTAKNFACYMARTGNYGHQADGRQPSQRATAHGFPKQGCVGENIAWNNYARHKQANILTNGWINSPPHRENMLTLGAKITGVGVCQQGDKFYGVQLVGRRNRINFEIVNRTAYPVQYSYQNNRTQPTMGVLQGHPNGWRSITLSTCQYAKITAILTRPNRFGASATVEKSKMMGDKKQKMIFGQ